MILWSPTCGHGSWENSWENWWSSTGIGRSSFIFVVTSPPKSRNGPCSSHPSWQWRSLTSSKIRTSGWHFQLVWVAQWHVVSWSGGPQNHPKWDTLNAETTDFCIFSVAFSNYFRKHPMSHPEFVQILRWNPALMPKIPAVVSCSNFGSLMRFSQIWKSKCLTFPTWENHGKIHHGAMVGKEYGHSNTQWIWESPNISRVVKPEPPFFDVLSSAASRERFLHIKLVVSLIMWIMFVPLIPQDSIVLFISPRLFCITGNTP